MNNAMPRGPDSTPYLLGGRKTRARDRPNPLRCHLKHSRLHALRDRPATFPLSRQASDGAATSSTCSERTTPPTHLRQPEIWNRVPPNTAPCQPKAPTPLPTPPAAQP
jgi:hypothetical protein